MNDKPLIIFTFSLFIVAFIIMFFIQIKIIPAFMFLICVLITISYSIIYFKDRKRLKKLDRITFGLFWSIFVFSTIIINIIIFYIGIFIPAPTTFIWNAPVPPQYQWIEPEFTSGSNIIL